MKNNTKTNLFDSNIIKTAILLAILILNFLFLFLSGDLISTINKLYVQEKQLTEQKQIVDASSQILGKYKDEIDMISEAFPNEETILSFIQIVEENLKSVGGVYKFSFSPSPIAEGDKLFLIVRISLNTTPQKLIEFISKFETLPYLTHVQSISSKIPNGFDGEGEYQIQLKLYVQNPFTP